MLQIFVTILFLQYLPETVYDSKTVKTAAAFCGADVAVPDRLSGLSGFSEHDFCRVFQYNNHLLSVVNTKHLTYSFFFPQLPPVLPVCFRQICIVIYHSYICLFYWLMSILDRNLLAFMLFHFAECRVGVSKQIVS